MKKFRPTLLPTLVVLLLLPILISLGIWQLHRAEFKRELQYQFDHRPFSAPLSLRQLREPQADIAYYPLVITGHFDNNHSLLLDNKIYQHRLGYQVITPFFPSKGGSAVLINRGWVPAKRQRTELPNISPVNTQVTLRGIITLPAAKSFVLGDVMDEKSTAWPVVIQQIDHKTLSKKLGYSLYPVIMLLDANQPYGFMREWQPVQMKSAMHIGYAVQWFALALTLIIGYIIVSRRHEYAE